MTVATKAGAAPGRARAVAAFRRSVRVRWALVAFYLVLLAGVRAAKPERDPIWEARAGLESLAGSPLARPDTWSWSQPGGTWYPNSPAWNVVLALGWKAAGYWGLFWLGVGSILVFVGLALAVATKLRIRPLPGLVGLLITLFSGFAMLSARATLAVHILILVGVLFADWVAPRLVGLPVALGLAIIAAAGLGLSVLGNWIHLSFLAVSVAFVVMWASQWLLTPGLGRVRVGLLTAAGTIGLLGGLVLSPYGVAGGLSRAAAVQEACAGLILEWAPAWASPYPEWWFAAAFALVLAGVALHWSWKTWRRTPHDPRLRLVLPLAVIGVPAAVGGLLSIRFIGVSLFALLPFAALAATDLANRAQRRARDSVAGLWASTRAVEYTSGRFWTVVLAAVAVILVPVGALFTSQGATPPEQAAVDQLPRGCRLFSSAMVAAPAVLTRPDVTVWMDGRADYFGRQQLIEAYRIMGGTDPVPAGATCVILGTGQADPDTAGAFARLDRDPDWRRLADDGQYVLWVPARP